MFHLLETANGSEADIVVGQRARGPLHRMESGPAALIQLHRHPVKIPLAGNDNIQLVADLYQPTHGKPPAGTVLMQLSRITLPLFQWLVRRWMVASVRKADI